MITITVGGPPGAGTSTVCRLLEKSLKIEYIYAGQIFRDKARSLGYSLSQFGDICEKDPKFDRELDSEMIQLAKNGNILIEGRMIGPLCKKKDIPSFRIYIDADPKERARRVMERDGGTLDEVILKMKDREESEAERYLRYYNIDPRDSFWYELIVDSTNMTPEEELTLILSEIGSDR